MTAAVTNSQNPVKYVGCQRMVGNWGDYTRNLQERGLVSNCAIYSLKGQLWSTTRPTFLLNENEFARLIAGFEDAAQLRWEGMHIVDTTFTLTRLSNRNCMMVFRHSGNGNGCIVYKCRRCIVIATHEEGVSPGACYSIVERLGDLLTDTGY